MPDRPRSSTSRRRFLGALGATAALPLVGAIPTWADPPATPQAAKPEPEPPADPESEADAADAKSLLEIIERRFGTRFDTAQLEAIRDDLQSSMRAGRTLRGFPLRNSDEPDVVFRALMGEK